jgi:hypothetical protein
MIGILVFLIVLAVSPILKEITEEARDPSHLDCSNSSISTGTKATCIVTDLYLFGFIASVLGGGISYLSLRRAGVD